MADKRIVVFGITGQQGGSVAKYLLEDKQFQIVGITRNTESAKSKKLKEQGVELFKGDLDDPASLEAPLKGAYGVFLNTNWWQWYKGDAEKDNAAECTKHEVKQATDAIKKAKEANVKHLVYSTLGIYKIDGKDVQHCHAKVLIQDYLEKSGVPATTINTAYYMENVLGIAPSEERSDGSVLLINPLPEDVKIPTLPIAQLGLWARLAFDDPKKWIGEQIQAATDSKSNAEIAEILTEVTGRKFEAQHNTPDEFIADKSQAKEMKLNSMVFFEGLAKPDIAKSRSLVKGSWDYKDFALNGGGVKAKWGLKGQK